MPAKDARSPEQVAIDEINSEIEQAVKVLAAEQGPALGAKPVSDAKELALWGQVDPTVDYDSMVRQLQTTGLPPAMLDPTSDTAPALIQQHPDMAQMFAQPVAPDVASVLAHFAEYPFRLSILEPYEDDPEAQVKKANGLDARWQRTLGRPTPEQPPEQQPRTTPTRQPRQEGAY